MSNPISNAESQLARLAGSRGFSIITNFGCARRCWYCVWLNGHTLKYRRTSHESTDWERLEQLIRRYPGEKLNVSGGGDPLFEFERNRCWWQRLIALAADAKKKLDVHTRAPVADELLLAHVNKFVVSFDRLEDLPSGLEALGAVKTRIAKVITKDTTFSETLRAVLHARRRGWTLTFKQLYGFDDRNNFDRLERELSKLLDLRACGIRFLPQDDYNIYFMPDNRLYDKFIIGAGAEVPEYSSAAHL